MYVFVFPARTYLAQQRSIASEQHEVAVLQAEDAKLAAESASLSNDATIERIAREEYGLVKPGQQAFTVLPPPASQASATSSRQSRPTEHAAWYSRLEFWRYL
jgi:cell division protein FtsB